MAGIVTRILPLTQYDLTSLVASTGSTTVTVARRIAAERMREAIVVGRLHTVTWTTGGKIEILVSPDGYTEDDPAANWNIGSGASTPILFQQSTDPVAPVVRVGSVTVPFAPLLMIQLKFSQGSAQAAFRAGLSIDLNLKGE